MIKRRILLGMVSVVLAVVALLVIDQIRQANAWPSINDQPPLAVPQVQVPTDSWLALKAVMAAVPMQHSDRIRKALQEKGIPVDRGSWVLVTDQLKSLASLMGKPAIVSPIRKIGSEDSQLSLMPIIVLAQAQLLRGWDRTEGGDMLAAARDMLLVDRFGQQLVSGSHSLMMSVVGYSIQEMALKSLQQLLFIAHEPSVHALVSERLAVQAPPEGHLRQGLLRECAHSEELLLDPLKLADVDVRDAWASKGLPGTLFDQGATVAQLRKWCRAADAWLALLPAQRGRSPSTRPHGLSAALTYNVIGIEYLKIVSPEAHLHAAEAIHEQALHRRIISLLTAARRYGFEHSGELPERAEQLVPEFLTSVPLDPFTGKALKIEAEAIKTSRSEQVWITLPAAPSQP